MPIRLEASHRAAPAVARATPVYGGTPPPFLVPRRGLSKTGRVALRVLGSGDPQGLPMALPTQLFVLRISVSPVHDILAGS